MNWKPEDRDKNHFVTFGHQEGRIEALEADFVALNRDLLAYIRADIETPWLPAARRLADTLRTIIEKREAEK